MSIISGEYIGHSGVKYIFEYEDCDDFSILPYELCRQIYGVCFYNGKMVIVKNGTKNLWGLVGGTVEKGESFEETLHREIKEESNMKVLDWKPVGFQKVIDTRDNSIFYQLRVAATVIPYGGFIEDPAGSITEIAIIDPADYKQYFDWGKIGERIIERAEEFFNILK